MCDSGLCLIFEGCICRFHCWCNLFLGFVVFRSTEIGKTSHGSQQKCAVQVNVASETLQKAIFNLGHDWEQ